MSDVIINLVNELADARKEKWDLDLAYIKKTAAVDANAMGILQFIMEHYFKEDHKKVLPLYTHVKMVYSWLEYSSALSAKMFLEIGSGDRIFQRFQELYHIYAVNIDTTMTFSEWFENFIKEPADVNG